MVSYRNIRNSTLSQIVSRDGIGSYRVVRSDTVSYRVVRGGTVSYRNIGNSTRSYRVFGVVLCRTELYRMVQNRTQ